MAERQLSLEIDRAEDLGLTIGLNGAMMKSGCETSIMPKHKICLVECWFGQVSPWFDYYLRTCAANPGVSFLIFHDYPAPKDAPKNVRFLPLSRSQLEMKVERLLHASVSLSSSLKICDLRPAFGVLFADHLVGADFWGYNDSDLFWGDIRRFVTDDILSRYDAVTACRTCMCGQFSLLRNSGPTKEAYRLIPGYVNALKQLGPEYLDEQVLDEALISHGLKVYRKQLQVHDVGSVKWEEAARELELREQGNLGAWFWEEGPCQWINGRLTHIASRSEAMFFHFRSWKKIWRDQRRVPRLGYWRQMKGFRIGENGLTPIFKPGKRWLVLLYWLRYFAPLRFGRSSDRLRKTGQRYGRGLQRRLAIKFPLGDSRCGDRKKLRS